MEHDEEGTKDGAAEDMAEIANGEGRRKIRMAMVREEHGERETGESMEEVRGR